MHVTTKEVNDQGVHILTSVIEGDGAVELASAKAKLDARVISAQRTESGGVQVQVALEIVEPAAEKPAAALTPEQQAMAYLASKGIAEAEAKEDVEKFGASRILSARDQEASNQQKALDEELADKLAGR